ncbi:MAG TPA: hypothetical protein ENJ37_06320 [Deltaproteobacteria bacterium]|nr:hypothetical protein [Deltaproteobacteria bacterium]
MSGKVDGYQVHTELRNFLQHSSVYFVGNLLNRLAVFVLLPVYTNYLRPEEYGLLELVLVLSSITRELLGLRLGHATIRFFFEYDDVADRKRLVGTSLVSITVWCLLLTILLMAFSKHFSVLLYGSSEYALLIVLGFGCMFFEVTNQVPLAFMRAAKRSVLFVSSSFVHLVIRIALNIYLVVFLHKGVEGVLLGNLITSFFYWSFLNIFVIWHSGLSFDFPKLKNLWMYSYPLVIAALPGIFLSNMDRIFLGWYTSLETVGIYALAIRFGLLIHALLLNPFQMNYGPFRFSIMKQDNAPQLYSRMLIYFLYVVTVVGLAVAFFSREIIEVMASEAFVDAYKFVPFIVLAIIFNGINYIFQTGLMIAKKTADIAYITVIGAAVNVASLYILVPKLGIYGAIITYVLVSFLMMTLTYVLSQKYYRIDYDLLRAGKIAAVAFTLFLATSLLDAMAFYERVVSKTFLILTFPFLLVPLGFYTKGEIEKFQVLRQKVGLRFFSQ